MAQRGKRESRKPEAGESTPLTREYEGAATLDGLLAGAGASARTPEAVAIFKDALAVGMGPDEVIPDLFEEEPRFKAPAEARRLYANLFGLWDRVAAGGSIEPKPREEAPRRAAAPPPEPMAPPLSGDFVEAAWKHLVDLPAKDTERWLHKWQNTQPELTEALRVESGEDAAVFDTADTLAFETWAMMELAQSTRIRPVLMEEFLVALKADDSPEPALAAYIEEALEEAGLDDEQSLDEAQAGKAGRLAQAAVRALAKAR